jgi:hypothetical protein
MNGPRARRTLVAAALAAGGTALVVFGPPVCPTALFLGIPCPGCGLTRATLALMRGDVGAAVRLHPLVFVLAPLFAAALGAALLDYVRGGTPTAPARFTEWFSKRTRYGAALALLVALVGVWGARFAGYLGGPVPVETLRDVAARLHEPRATTSSR